MFAKIAQAFSRKPRTTPFIDAAEALYAQAMEQSRQPKFYTDYGVADSIDGRFDMLALHVAAIILRLREEEYEPEELREKERTLIDVMMADMDQSLREQSVGDSGVLRRVQKMGEALFGRIAAYEVRDEEALKPVIARNIFRTNAMDETQEKAAETLAEYIIEMRATLTNLSMEAMLEQDIYWPEVGGDYSTHNEDELPQEGHVN